MLLDRAGIVSLNPFPHIVIENALPEKYYQALLDQQPKPEEILLGRNVGPNQRVDLPTELATNILTSIWRNFCVYHSSDDFAKKAFALFGLNPKKYSVRCQPGLNTPSPTLSRVRGPHLDNPRELMAGLFYMPTDDDGGDLEICKLVSKPKFHGKLEIEDECVEIVKTVKYRPNTYVMFLNTRESVHSVTKRKSEHYRNLVNICIDVPDPLFFVGHGKY